MDDASKVKLFEDKGKDGKWNLSRWGVDYIKNNSASEHIPNCEPFVMATLEYAYKGNSDWSEFFWTKEEFADRNEVLDHFKKN